METIFNNKKHLNKPKDYFLGDYKTILPDFKMWVICKKNNFKILIKKGSNFYLKKNSIN